MRNQNNFGTFFLLTVLVLFGFFILFATPGQSADELDITGQMLTDNGIVARYQIPAASETAETPSLNVEGFQYATIQIVGGTDTLTGLSATYTVKGSAFPNAGYEVHVPATVGGATATISQYGAYTYELGGLNRLLVAAASNSTTQEVIISLTKERN